MKIEFNEEEQKSLLYAFKMAEILMNDYYQEFKNTKTKEDIIHLNCKLKNIIPWEKWENEEK